MATITFDTRGEEALQDVFASAVRNGFELRLATNEANEVVLTLLRDGDVYSLKYPGGAFTKPTTITGLRSFLREHPRQEKQ